MRLIERGTSLRINRHFSLHLHGLGIGLVVTQRRQTEIDIDDRRRSDDGSSDRGAITGNHYYVGTYFHIGAFILRNFASGGRIVWQPPDSLLKDDRPA